MTRERPAHCILQILIINACDGQRLRQRLSDHKVALNSPTDTRAVANCCGFASHDQISSIHGTKAALRLTSNGTKENDCFLN